MCLQRSRSALDLRPYSAGYFGLLVILITAVSAYGGAGDLDTSFGTAGLVTTDFGGAFDGVSGLAVRDDGKIVAVGIGGSSNRFSVAVYSAGGVLDAGFDGDGQLIFDQTGGDGDVAWAAGDKILVGTSWLGGAFGYVVARLNANGTFDATFGSGGKRTLSMGSQPYVEAMKVQADGKIILAGYSFFNSNWSWAMARFTAAGAVDASFDGDGIVTTDFSPTGSRYDMLYDIAIQPADGKIVAGGKSQNSSGYDLFTLARYNTNGSLDSSFGTGGTVVIPSGQISTRGAIDDVELLPDGKILACGYAGGDSILLRFDSNGALDTTFGTNGYRIVSLATSNDYFYSIVVDSAGRIIAVGTAAISSQRRQTVVRFRSDGSLDPVFGIGGKVVADFGTPWEEAHVVALTPDNWILVGGSTGTANVDSDYSLARFSNESTGSPHVIELTPLDGEAGTTNGTTWTLNTTGISIAVDRSGSSASEKRGLMEFDVSALPPEAEVVSAELFLDIAGLSFFPGVSYPFIEIYGYDGNGSLQTADASLISNLIGTSEPIMTQDPITVVLSDTASIESVRDRGANYLGLVLRAGRADHYAGFMATEGVSWGGLAPKLTIGYVVNPLVDIADFDGNGNVDAADYALFRACWSGTGVLPASGCESKDLDEDDDVDAGDLTVFQQHITEPGNPPVLGSAFSRKTHGASGNFDVRLPLPPGSAGIECRAGGPTKVILAFSKPVVAADGVPDGTEVSLSAGTLTAVTIADNEVTVDLIGVPDMTCLTISLAATLTDLTGLSLTGNTLQIRALLGDTNSSGAVSVADVNQTRSRSGQSANATTFLSDTNCTGSISVADVNQVRSRSGNAVTCP